MPHLAMYRALGPVWVTEERGREEEGREEEMKSGRTLQHNPLFNQGCLENGIEEEEE